MMMYLLTVSVRKKKMKKGSESPEKTLDELMADGWDWWAEDRVKATSPTSTDELKEPGSLLKHLCISSVPVNRVVKQRIEELEDVEGKLGNVIKENTDLKRKVSELEGQFEVLRMMKKAKKGKEMSPEQRQMLLMYQQRLGSTLCVLSSFQGRWVGRTGVRTQTVPQG